MNAFFYGLLFAIPATYVVRFFAENQIQCWRFSDIADSRLVNRLERELEEAKGKLAAILAVLND